MRLLAPSLIMLALGLAGCPSADPIDHTPDSGSPDGSLPDPDGSKPEPEPEPGDADPDLQNQESAGLKRESMELNGVRVVRYTWIDSTGRPRTVALKRQGPGNGGYAVHATYDVPEGAGWRTVTVRGTSGGEAGFGYFVAHERYRSFSDGSSGTIAAKHGQDDSPLGYGFAVTDVEATFDDAQGVATHAFRVSYPKWGTVAPMANVDGPTPAASDAHQRFELPLTIQWTFQNGMDFPRIDYRLDLSAATAGQLAFDVRGPYGVIEFADAEAAAQLSNVQWGDSVFHFNTRSPAAGFLTTGADWTWEAPIGDARAYNALITRHTGTGALYEIGLVELALEGDTELVYGGWSNNVGKTRASSGNALLSAGFGGGEWPFQSAQYSGVAAAAPVSGKKFAWGSSSLYGSQTNVQYLNPTTSVAITAYPPGGQLLYRVCWILGVSGYTDGDPRGLTRRVAESAAPSCATLSPLTR